MKKSTFREYLESILIAAILALFIRTFVFQAFKIPTGSMEPNLLVGDHIVVNKFVYAPGGSALGLLPVREIERGDVVVFRAPEDPDTDFIKRIVAVGGDTVELLDGTLYVNGDPVDEPYAEYSARWGSARDLERTEIPEGHYFALGDNRDNSRDSRYWGTVPEALVKGQAVMVYWSFEADGASYYNTGLSDRLLQIGQMLPRMISGTRWDRSLMLIR